MKLNFTVDYDTTVYGGLFFVDIDGLNLTLPFISDNLNDSINNLMSLFYVNNIDVSSNFLLVENNGITSIIFTQTKGK